MTTPSKVEVLETFTRAKDALDSSAGILNKLYERFPEVTVIITGLFVCTSVLTTAVTNARSSIRL